jgi:hypothetical protein
MRITRRRTALLSVPVLFVAAAGLATSNGGAAAAPTPSPVTTRTISLGATTTMHANAPGASVGIVDPEFPAVADGDAADGAGNGDGDGFAIVNRSYSGAKAARGVSVKSGAKAKANPQLGTHFEGLNFRQQRVANGGNQFSVEPPDQGLCAGNGYVVESVNDVVRVFHTDGTPATGVVDLNSFYGYPAAINRTTGVRGPFVTDPSCYFDGAAQRWFQVVLTLDTTPAGAFTGANHLDIAVSQTGDPTGGWSIYRLPAQDNGTDGTPDHGCSDGFCLGDYPHIGADANGFFVTTNEYSFFGPEFKSAQIYAFSKAALARGDANVLVTQIDTSGLDNGNPGFTIWPATSTPSQWATGQGGTEYFLSSNAAEEANGTGTSSRLLVWSLTNTASLNSASPAVVLQHASLAVDPYAVPPKANQKAGSIPLGECLNDSACATFLTGAPDPFAPEPESVLDSNDTRMQQVTYANGKIWGALDTALTINGQSKAGVEYFIAKPSFSTSGNLSATVKDGYLGLAGNNLTYPAIGVTPSGRGVLAFTVAGDDYYPSAGYAGLDAVTGAGDVHIAGPGAGPEDGFSGYRALNNPLRPRWGDYGATAVVDGTVWTASEYIAQTCTLAQYESAPFGSCGGTRATLGNWSTHISAVTP